MLLFFMKSTFICKKSRIKWMDKGDGNNSIFFNQCKSNWNVNKILSINNKDGILVSGQANCAQVAVDYFQEFLGTSAVEGLIDLC